MQAAIRSPYNLRSRSTFQMGRSPTDESKAVCSLYSDYLIDIDATDGLECGPNTILNAIFIQKKIENMKGKEEKIAMGAAGIRKSIKGCFSSNKNVFIAGV